MDTSLEFSQDYTFSKLAGYRLLLPFSFPFSFLFPFYYLQSLPDLFVLGFWTFTTGSF
jgi:hypothetical protein